MNNHEVRFREELYSSRCILEAANRMSKHFSCTLDQEGDYVVAKLTFAEGVKDQAERIAEFEKEVADQCLREIIRGETQDIRRLILAHAFSKTGLAQ